MNTNGNITYSSGQTFDLQQTLALSRVLKREHEEWQESTRVAVRQIEPCRVCGKRIDFETKPYERFVVCRCMLAELKRQYQPPVDVVLPDIPDMMGIRVEVK